MNPESPEALATATAPKTATLRVGLVGYGEVGTIFGRALVGAADASRWRSLADCIERAHATR